MEYVEDLADRVYVYALCEQGIISSRFFYLINDTHVKCHKVNDALRAGDEKYDVSRNRQSMVMRILCEDIKKIQALCTEYQKEMPTEMKVIYDVKSGKFTAEYKYDLLYTNDDVKTATHMYNEWFEEVKKKKL